MEGIGILTLKLMVLVVMLVGLAGLIIPVLPGLVFIWAGALVYGLVMGFDLVSGILFGIMTVFMLVGSVIDNVMMGASAKVTGASWLAIGVAFAASIVGTFVWPPVGGLLLALAGLFIVEWIRLRDWKAAMNSTKSWALGCGGSVLVRVGMGVIMIMMWIYWAFFLTGGG